MTKLYVANLTDQDHIFIFKLPEKVGPPLRKVIPAKRQEMIPGVQSPVDCTAIIEHHSPYGMRAVEELGREGMVPLVYSIDKPVSSRVMDDQYARNKRVLFQRGEEQRKIAAVQTNRYMEDVIEQQQMPIGLPSSTMIEIIEGDRNTDDKLPMVAERITVDRRSGAGARPTPPPSGRRSRRH